MCYAGHTIAVTTKCRNLNLGNDDERGGKERKGSKRYHRYLITNMTDGKEKEEGAITDI